MATETKNTKAFYNIEIPSDWEVRKLIEITEKIGDGLHGTPEYVDNSIYFFINGNNIKDGSVIINNDTKCIGEEEYLKHRKDLKYKALLLSINGTIGSIAFYRNERIVLGKSAAYINCNDENVDFLFHYLQSSQVLNFYEEELTGSTIRNLSLKSIRDTPIKLPPLPEQRSIARILSTADAAIHSTEKLIAQKELRKKWLMQQLLTGKKRLKGFEGEWKEYSYDKILKVVKRDFDWDENELYKLISVRRRSGGIFYREALYGNQILVKTLRTANEGDFLFSKMQILHGASALVTKEFDGAKISGSYIAVVAKDKKQLNMEFFQWYSQVPYFYHQTYISSYGVHIEKMTFDFETFLQLEMKLPSYQEQTAITRVLQTVDKEISLLKAKAEKLREQKKGLMQVLLTGKKRLNQDFQDSVINRMEEDSSKSGKSQNPANNESDN